MASYLLKAQDDDLDRWKRVAKERGESFADFARSALEDRATRPHVAALTGEGARMSDGQVRSFSKEQQASGRYDR